MPDDFATPREAPPRASWLRLILLLPFAAVLWVALYDRVEPRLFGIPFFYWYQLLWVILAAVCVGIVYRVEHAHLGSPR